MSVRQKKLVWNLSFPLNKVLVYDTRTLPTKLESNLQTKGFLKSWHTGKDARETTSSGNNRNFPQCFAVGSLGSCLLFFNLAYVPEKFVSLASVPVCQLPRQCVCEAKKLVWDPSFPLNKVLVYDGRMLPTKLQSNLQTLGFSGVDVQEKTREWQIPREHMRDFGSWHSLLLHSCLYSREIYYSRIFFRVSTPETICLWGKTIQLDIQGPVLEIIQWK
jgi:hypothetical protein